MLYTCKCSVCDCILQLSTKTAFLVPGERYNISIPYINTWTKRSRVVIVSALPWPISYPSATVRIFQFHIIISAPSTRLRTTKLINSWHWVANRIALFDSNVEISTQLFRIGWRIASYMDYCGSTVPRTKNSSTCLPHPPNTSFLTILLLFAFGKKILHGRIKLL